MLLEKERLRNEDEGKTDRQMRQSFNQFSENETKIWGQNIPNRFNRVSSFSFRNLSIITTEDEHCHDIKLEPNARAP